MLVSSTRKLVTRAAAGCRSASTITKIVAREILDSRGNPTCEADIVTKDGIFRAAVPSGASTGIHEAVELRDGDKKRYMGKGVLKAVANVSGPINDRLKGFDVTKQKDIDEAMLALDGTANKAKLGANAILAVSLAAAKAGAAAKKVPLYKHFASLAGNDPDGPLLLPIPMSNVINGGVHAANALAPQEFMLAPLDFPSYSEALRAVVEIYHTLKGLLKAKYGLSATGVGDEGGFAPPTDTFEAALDILQESIKKAGYEGKVKIAME
jgi:enolase